MTDIQESTLDRVKALEERIAKLEQREHKHDKLYYGSTEYIGITSGNVVINETGADVDFRVESDTNANMLVVDGALYVVGIGGAAAAGKELKVTGDLQVTATTQLDSTLTVDGAASLKGGLVVNEDSADVDFRVESNGNANMLVVDAGLDAVGIGGAAVSGVELTVTGDTKTTGITALSDSLERTISGGAITITRSFHTVDTEGDAASDDLDTINGGVQGAILVLCAKDSGRTVVVKDAGNLRLAGDMSLDNVSDSITLIYAASAVWRELSRSDNAA